MTLVGVSTAVLARRVDLSPLLDLRPDIVEWYALPSSVVGEIERFGAYGIQSALHAPMPFEGPGTPRFAPTSVDSDLAAAALTMVRRTLECARSLGALYVVIHFPDPDPPYAPAGFSDRAAAFLDEVIELSSRSSIPVLLENMTPNPCLRSPAQYESVLARYPELGLCLDLGHAHLTQPSHTLDAYIDALAGRVRAVHVYNTTPARYAQHGHEPIAERQATDDGYFDWRKGVARLLEATKEAALIVEHDARFGASATREALRQLRMLVEGEGERAHAEAF